MIGVVGGGAWGTTLAKVAAQNDHEVALWVRQDDAAKRMAETRENETYLPGIKVPDSIEITSDIRTVVDGRSLVLHVVPSHATREVAQLYADELHPDAVIVSATKGLERGSNLTMSQVIEEVTGRAVVALSGPNHAEEVGTGQPSGAVCAHPRYPVANRVVDRLGSNTFKLYAHPDRTGVELCAAYKNVVAVATGMASGLSYGDNTQAALITLGLQEMARVLPIMGGERRTAYGLAGIGDLVATCTSRHSRNRYFGRRVAEGLSVKEAIDEMGGKVVEGYHAARAFQGAGEHHGIKLALTRAVCEVVDEDVTVVEAMETLIELV